MFVGHQREVALDIRSAWAKNLRGLETCPGEVLPNLEDSGFQVNETPAQPFSHTYSWRTLWLK